LFGTGAGWSEVLLVVELMDAMLRASLSVLGSVK